MIEFLLVFWLSQVAARPFAVYVITDDQFSATFVKDVIETLESNLDPNAFEPEHYTLSTFFTEVYQPRAGCIIMEATSQTLEGYALRQFASAHACAILSTTQASVRPQLSSVFYTHPTPEEEAAALQAVLVALEWAEFHLLSTELTVATTKVLNNGLTQVSPEPATYTVVGSGSLQSIYNSYAAIGVKRSGNWKVVVVAKGEQATLAFNGLVAAKIFRAGCGLLLGSQAIWGSFGDGAILLVEQGLESAQSEGQYEALGVAKLLNSVDLSRTDPAEALAAAFPSHRPSPMYTLLNQVSAMTSVGTVTGSSVTFESSIVFPGSLPAIPDSLPIIMFSVDVNIMLPSGEPEQLMYQMLQGLPIMIQSINADSSLLDNFEVVMYPLDCGAAFFSYAHHKPCLESHIQNLGLFRLELYESEVAQGTIQIFRELGLATPQIGLYYNDLTLYSKEMYPEMITISNSDLYLAAIAASMIEGMGWRHVSIIMTDATEGFNELMIEQCENIGLTVMNKEQRFPQNYTTADFPQYKHMFEEIYWSGSRIIVLLLQEEVSLAISEALYDVGFRNGDAFITTAAPFGSILPLFEDAFDFDKILEIIDGSVSFLRSEYIGDYGQELQSFMSTYMENTDYTCYAIDQMTLGLHAVDMMLNLGRDYEDAELLNYFIRMQRFQGCTGKVYIASESNERNPVIYSLINFRKQGDGWIDTVVGTYTLGAVVPLQYTDTLYFPGGETEPPPDLRDMTLLCNFDLAESSFHVLSFASALVLAIGALLSGAAVGIYVYQRDCKYEVVPLAEEMDITFEDALIFIACAVEGYLLLALGPDFSMHAYLLDFVASSQYTNLASVIRYEGSSFWNTLYVAFGVTILWEICTVIHMLGLRNRVPKFLRSTVDFFGVKLVPIFASALSVLLIDMLLHIYVCDQGNGSSVTSSVLRADCDTWCWKDKHLAMTVLISIALVIFVPLTFVVFAYYDRHYFYVAMKTNPNYTVLKRVLLLVLVALAVFLKPFYYFSFCLAYIGVMAVLVCVTFLKKPYNYSRFNLWQRILYSGVLWSMLCALVHESTEDRSDLLTGCFQGIGSVALIVFGILWQRKHCPSYLKRQQNKDIPKLFRFQLSNQVKANELMKHELDYADREPRSATLRRGPTWFLGSSPSSADNYMLKRSF